MIVSVILGFYFLVCISVVQFNCWKVLSDRAISRRMERRKANYIAWYKENLADISALTPTERDRLLAPLARSLRASSRLLALHAALDELRAQDPDGFAEKEAFIAELIQRALPYYEGKADTLQAYYSYLVTHFHVMKLAPAEPLTAYLFAQLRAAKSLYNIENALRAVYSSGEVALVLEALQILDGAEGVFIHEKLLIDGLLTFEDSDALIAALWERFPRYGTQMRELLLDYIRFASDAWKEQMLALLAPDEELEAKIAALRYFGRYPDERVRTLLYELSRDGNSAQWELCAVCMTVLASYPGEETIALLKQGLRSRNWYVRYNAALSLRALNVSAEHVQDVISGDDRYAREMLQYRLGQNAAAGLEREAVSV